MDMPQTVPPPVLGTVEDSAEATELLKPIWLPLLGHLESGSIIPRSEEWLDDAEQLQRLAREGWMAAWGQLGLRPRPEGDGMYLAVEDPSLSGTHLV